MKLDAEILLKQYYEKVKDNYPSVSYEEFKKICYSPFEFVKQEISSGELPVIRLKYFGTFLVYPKRAEGLLKKLENMYQYNKISEEKYLKYKKMIINYLNES